MTTISKRLKQTFGGHALRVRLYKHKDPDQPIVFSAEGTAVFELIKRWMDLHELDYEVQGLCLYCVNDAARFLSTAHTQIVTIYWESVGGGGWCIRRGHDVDDTMWLFSDVRDQFLEEVIRYAKRWVA